MQVMGIMVLSLLQQYMNLRLFCFCCLRFTEFITCIFDKFIVVDKFLLSFSISFADILFIGASRTLVDSNWHLSTFTSLVPITNYVPV